jgi:hypothetical protein
MISRLPPPGIQLILTIPRQAGLYRARPAAHGRQPVLADVGMVGLIAGTNQRHAALDTERDPAPEAASTLSTAASIVRLTSSAAATGRPEPVSYRLQIPRSSITSRSPLAQTSTWAYCIAYLVTM